MGQAEREQGKVGRVQSWEKNQGGKEKAHWEEVVEEGSRWGQRVGWW